MKKSITQSFLWLCFIGFSISNGNAQTYLSGCYRIVNKATGKVLEVEGNSLVSGARIRQATATGAANQLWQEVYHGYISYSFISRSSNFALDLPICTEGATIRQSSFVGQLSSSSRWGLNGEGGDYFSFRQCTKALKAETNSDTVRIVTTDLNALSDNFLWKIEKIPCPSICPEPSISTTADTVCVGSILKLNIINTSSSNPTVTWTYNGGFTPYTSGFVSSSGVITGLYPGNLSVHATVYDGVCTTDITKTIVVVDNCPLATTVAPSKCYHIVNKVSNKSLEVKDASTAEGAIIYQWTTSEDRYSVTTIEGKASQLWQINKLADGRYSFVSKSSGKLIDVPDCTEGTVIKQYAYDGTDSQKWRLDLQTDGSYKFFNASCNKFLRLENGSTADGASVGIKNDFGTAAFKWLIQEAVCPVVDCNILPYPTYSAVQPSGLTTGSITLTNLPTGASSSINGSPFVVDKKVYSGLLAGVYNIKVRLNACESISQATLTNSSLRTFDPASCYYIISKTSNKVLEVKNASLTDGAQIYQFTASTTKKNQFWQIVKTSDGSFNIISKNNNKLIDAPDCTEGGLIQQFAADGTSSQKWQIVPQADGSVKLLNVSCNKYLRVESGSTADSASVGIKNDFGAESFLWYIAVAPCPPDNCPPTPILSFVLPTFSSLGSITVTNLPPNVSTSLEGPLIDNPVFTLNKSVYPIAAEGLYKIKLRINGCTTEATANLTRTRTPVTYAAGCFRIINKATGKALTVKNAALTDGAAIVQAAYTGSANQLWTQSLTGNFGSAAGTGYISKNSKAWLKANEPTSFCIDDTTPAYQSQFMFQWFPQTQADGSFKIFKYPQAICNKLVLRVDNNTSEIVSSATDTNDDFSKWVIDSVSCTTPVVASATAETFGFEARASEGRAKLQWVTNTSYKTDYFEIERLNAQGHFEVLSTKNTEGGEGLKSYTFTDNNPLDGDNFYRINSISNGNTAPQYSEVKKVSFSKNDGISIFPNPADEFINVDLRKYEGKTVALSVYNSVGFLVKKQTIEKVSAAPQQIDVQGFGTGSYLLRVQSEGKREVTRLFHIVK